MNRGPTGKYLETRTGDEVVRSFIPFPLPPDPPLEMRPDLRESYDQALLSLGRLDSVTTLLPVTDLFLYTCVRREAVLSSQIEGTQSTLSDLLLFELGEAPGVPLDDVKEVSHYVKAMEHGLRRLNDGFPLSNRLLREIHQFLLSGGGRGSGKEPGRFRSTQNWIQGGRPGNALFVPAPPDRVQETMAELENFLHDKKERTPALIKAAIAHVQFETIHPFLDGNGRVGRLLITLVLCNQKVLREPMLYLSLYLKQHRTKYFELLMRVRQEGDWEGWLEFFLTGVRDMAEGAVSTARRLHQIAKADETRIRCLKRQAGSAHQVHRILQQRPLVTIPFVVKAAGSTTPTATSALLALQELGIVREITGRKRNRVFSYDGYMKVLVEGTES